ncbi:uncharacterized protein EI90DRAFT_809197 [Cantharellus anzutake]|uniref:uncharacterized protein n=1 Tax=Cantharellus anzutake TaxID=1750568 RepID=UPI0019086487|nr:uncharacterized protein EI90DRAFT_809197 [Cantharellus anzutake]KAF8342938.1 hypothetical protein EI90DRAFT_809197 [Cantharellus anzutake]
MASDDPKRSKEGTTAPGSTGSSSPEQQNQPANDGKHTSPATPVEGSFPNANAPRSDWPLPSTHEYEPWTKNKNSSSPGKGEAADNFTIPSIVTLTGRPSPWPSAPNRVDERCVIYCTQTAARRVAGEPPICKTWCYRRLFPHDYSPVGQSARVKPDGNSGRVGDASGYSERPQKPFAFDGKYVYFGRSRYRARNRMYSMSGTGLPRDPSLEEMANDSVRGDRQGSCNNGSSKTILSLCSNTPWSSALRISKRSQGTS